MNAGDILVGTENSSDCRRTLSQQGFPSGFSGVVFALFDRADIVLLFELCIY